MFGLSAKPWLPENRVCRRVLFRFSDAEKPRLMCAAHRYDVVGKLNKFRKPISLPPTPWDVERNAIDHRPGPSNLKTAVA
jgi:hypothetical protein